MVFKHLERVHQDYPGTEVEVMAVITRANVKMLSSFGRRYRTSFTILADPGREIRGRRYRVRRNPAVVIIDMEGMVRYAGGFTTAQVMKEKIESIRIAPGG